MSDFSCLISCYIKDSPSQLDESLKSIANQSLLANEIVFVKDGPLNKNLEDVLLKYESQLPFKFVNLPVNKGLGNALNEGLKHCSNDIILRMDTDDICFLDRFEKQVNFLSSNPDIDIVGSWCIEVDDEGNKLNYRKYPKSHEELIKLIWTCPINHPTVAFRKSKIIQIGSYNTSIKRRQDYELWFRAAINGLKFHNIQENLLYYRTSPNYFNKNDFKVSWLQTKIGWKGLFNLKVFRPIPYIGVAYPLFRLILPDTLKKYIQRRIHKIDPRNI